LLCPGRTVLPQHQRGLQRRLIKIRSFEISKIDKNKKGYRIGVPVLWAIRLLLTGATRQIRLH